MSTIDNTILSTTNAAIAMAGQVAEAVVQHDTSAQASIKLASLGVPVTVSVESNATAPAQNDLAAMELARINWETTELAASNKRLYSILRDAYNYYLVMKKDTKSDVRKAHADKLEQFIKERGYTFMPSTHDMTRVVKCVFGVDRRRVSAYSIALREALRQEIAAADLVTFIEENGGVEQIRMGGTKPLSVTKRADMAKCAVLGTDLGTLKFDPKLFAADADWADKQVVIVATYLPTGEFQANAVIKHDSAVNTALAAVYSQQQAKQREAAKADREAEAAVAKTAKAAEKEQAKQAKAEQQPQTAEAQRAMLDAIAAARKEHAANMAEIKAKHALQAA